MKFYNICRLSRMCHSAYFLVCRVEHYIQRVTIRVLGSKLSSTSIFCRNKTLSNCSVLTYFYGNRIGSKLLYPFENNCFNISALLGPNHLNTLKAVNF